MPDAPNDMFHPLDRRGLAKSSDVFWLHLLTAADVSRILAPSRHPIFHPMCHRCEQDGAGLTRGSRATVTTFDGFEVYDVRFPTSRLLDGSDAMNTDPDYSLAYVVIGTDARESGASSAPSEPG